MSKSESVAISQPAGDTSRGRNHPPPRVLVVDDDKDSRQLTLDVLAGSGYDAEGATDGAAAWEALQTFDYDLVITDNHMPRMTGVEMLTRIRACHMSVPVIMATGHLPVLEFARRPWIVPDLALERPITNDDLLAAVRKILGSDADRPDLGEPPPQPNL